MYKLLLCQRYLRTRYIALASIISVTLGVATMIVVNSVMAGFGSEMRSRIQGILSDIIIDSRSMNGEFDPEAKKALIRSLVGKYISGVTATVEVHAILSFKYGHDYIPHPVMLVGIDPETKSEVGPLGQYLQSYQSHTDNGKEIPAERPADEPLSWELTPVSMKYRVERAKRFFEMEELRKQLRQERNPEENIDEDPFKHDRDVNPEQTVIGAMQPGRLYVGAGLATYMQNDPDTQQQRTYEMIRPGDDVKISTVTAGTPSPVHFDATIIDTFKTGMSEYDSSLVYCNLDYLQRVRKMIRQNEDGSEVAAFTSLQIKLKDYKDAPKVVEILRGHFTAENYIVKTWEQRQGPLLAAVDVESSILNILLFLIITVAGFGILAIFFMIVVEKTRDIGILKALGASSSGVMSIFLSYGLLLGMVGAGAGVVVGLLFVHYINQIEAFISFVTGREVFPETIYYFKDIPTHVEPFTVLWVSFGAVMIAVLASVLPARRAAQLQPVKALRYE
jgi:lipoprotein-releasing system permease protein